MNESNSIEIIDKTNLTEQTKFRLDQTSKTGNYFDEEINQRKSCSKKLNKYVAAFDYIDKVLINCFRCNKWWSIYHFIYECCWRTSWNCKCKLYFNVFSNNWDNQKITKYNKKQKEKP